MTAPTGTASAPIGYPDAPPAPGLEARSVGFAVRGKRLLDQVDLAIRPGRITAVVGPNGAGKSTLLRVMAGELPCTAGVVTLEGRPLSTWPLCDHARRRAVLPQQSTLSFDLRVEAVVELGRMPHAGVADPVTDGEIVRAALDRAGAGKLAGRSYPTLSGGEKQRVHLARVLAQIWSAPADGGRYLLLDEPLSAQDLGRQHQVMRFVGSLATEGVGVMIVLHDLNLAARYSHDLLLLHRGCPVAHGTPTEVLTPERIRHTFAVDTVVARDPVSGTPLIVATGTTSPTPQTEASA